MFIYKCGIVGAGAMGSGIAQVVSFSGLPVVLYDVSSDKVEAGLAKVRAIYAARVAKGKMSQAEMDQRMSLIQGSTDINDFKDCDLVVEAVFENMAVKKEVFQKLETILPSSAIMATNTSALSITELAASVKDPSRVIGMHFFNPAPVMKLVEVIPGLQTSSQVIDDVITFAGELRKLPVRVKECAGFLVNRLLMPYLNEAMHILTHYATNPADIDKTMRDFGMPVGPLALADMLGLDVCGDVADILLNSFGPRMDPCSLLELLTDHKIFGVKSGQGFYPYDISKTEAQEVILAHCNGNPSFTRRSERIPRELMIYQMINEAAYCLEENVASPSDIDLAMLAGTGFPQDKGGPLHYADSIGVDLVLRSLEEAANGSQARYWPAPLLRRMVAAGYTGVKAGRGFFNY